MERFVDKRAKGVWGLIGPGKEIIIHRSDNVRKCIVRRTVCRTVNGPDIVTMPRPVFRGVTRGPVGSETEKEAP